eukprot:NODE_1727_length_1318_cov_23.387707_g1438_i0.p1 GENE.NODE_1727_length_1318_cov_23.387707_g1438_i0~~NODE_1727_length_1318_cov_23.387707_g1438_i0.p1  ORF type:complete len:395 (-),score=77.23 NODE_1727_length_1318_cov_23.387707_g1438_i0:133-1167(-)
MIDRSVTAASYHVTHTAKSTYATAKAKANQEIDELAKKRFRDNFSSTMESGEVFLGDFKCKVINHAGPASAPWYDGWLQVTNTRLCFVCDNKLTFFFTLVDVVSIQKAITSKTSDSGLLMTPLPAPDVIPQAIQVFTRQSAVHQFFQFTSMRSKGDQAIQDAFNTIDFAWRGRVQVPNPAYQYLPPGQPGVPLFCPGYMPAPGSPEAQQQPGMQMGTPLANPVPDHSGAPPPGMGAPPPLGVPAGARDVGPPGGNWSCPSCTYNNPPTNPNCQMCQAARPAPGAQEKQSAPLPPPVGFSGPASQQYSGAPPPPIGGQWVPDVSQLPPPTPEQPPGSGGYSGNVY